MIVETLDGNINNNLMTGFTCNTCGKIFETEEEFRNRHKKKSKKDKINKD